MLLVFFMKKNLAYISFFLCQIITAQTNLVVNPSFENYTNCPTTAGQINYAINWFQPNFATTIPGGSTDYFNSCSVSPLFSIPNNQGGYQNPLSGYAYAAIATFSTTSDYREYIENKLKEPLKKGKKYCVTFYSNLANLSKYGSNNIGAYFSPDSLIYANLSFAPIGLVPQIIQTPNLINVDTINWQKISGELIAQGGEEYVTIGNFYYDITTANTNTGGIFDGAYYYIDDVSVICCDCDPSIPNVFTPNNDGINDLFEISNLPASTTTQIYNRWGIEVFETNKEGVFWDGRTTSGVAAGSGTYFYIITTEDETYKGFLQLVR